jgi:hypothetical protein
MGLYCAEGQRWNLGPLLFTPHPFPWFISHHCSIHCHLQEMDRNLSFIDSSPSNSLYGCKLIHFLFSYSLCERILTGREKESSLLSLSYELEAMFWRNQCPLKEYDLVNYIFKVN